MLYYTNKHRRLIWLRKKAAAAKSAKTIVQYYMKYLFKWYVYELIDPRNGKCFYVGKGAKNRIDSHEKEARKGVCSEKCNKIRDIENSGYSVIKNKIAYFKCEELAYETEKKIIKMYGDKNLTNIHFGGKLKFKQVKSDVLPKEESIMQCVYRSARHIAFWIKYGDRFDYSKNLNSSFAKILSKSIGKYYKMILDAGIKENPNLTRAIFSEYGVII